MASSTGLDAGITALRAEYALLQAAASLSRGGASRHDVDASILGRLRSLDAWRQATVVLAYPPQAGGPDATGVIEMALADGKSVALPLREPGSDSIAFHLVSEEGEGGTVSDPSLGLAVKGEPLRASEMVGSVCLVPGLVFDGEGNRIASDDDAYDGFLAFYPGYKVGVCRSMQVSGNVLPRLAHDVPMDYLVTEGGTWECRKA